MDEVVPAGSERPGDAHDVCPLQEPAYVKLSGCLRARVRVTRIQRHPLFVPGRIVPAEYFIRADMDHLGSGLEAGQSDILRSQPVDLVGQCRIAGTTLHVCIGCAMDDHVGFCGTEGAHNCRFVDDIYFWKTDSGDGMLLQGSL